MKTNRIIPPYQQINTKYFQELLNILKNNSEQGRIAHSLKIGCTDSMTRDKVDELTALDSVSKRLKYLVDTLGVKQSHMAEKLGVSASGLHYILNNDVKFSKNAQKIADYLNVSAQWLSTGIGEIYEENTSIKTYKIPVYYPDQLKLYYLSQEKDKIHTNDFIITANVYTGKTIGVHMTETYFAPKFEVGEKIAFEQVEQFQDGEILLIYLKKLNCVTLKFAFHAENEMVLISHNEKPIKFSPENDKIIGAYRECLKKT